MIQDNELIIDLFAGGGGASTGIESALGRSPDVAINHDPDAIGLHAANHGDTEHYCANVWQVDPEDVTRRHGRRRVGLLWASPDCKHFSKAKGGRPAKRHIRDLAWVVVLWAKRARPRVICLENVEEFRDWGPLVLRGGKWMPCPERQGETFKRWVGELKRLGYRIEYKELRGCNYGAPTIRKRMFLVARCDNQPIVWPEPTHGAPDDPDVIAGRKRPWRTAAEIIDWSLPCPSIFESSEEIRRKHGVRAIRPLAENTLRRVARGVVKYVLEAEEPFFVTYAQQGGAIRSAEDPLHTITASSKDQNAIVAAFLAQHNGGVIGHDARKPVSTLTGRSTQQNVVAAHLINMKGSDRRSRPADAPLSTICTGSAHAGIVAAYLTKYYGVDQDPRLTEPLHTVTTKDRFSLVTVSIEGQAYAIVDIGMRMLTPRELFTAQGFPKNHIIDRTADGQLLNRTTQIRLCGNSVCPPLAEALLRAQFNIERKEAAA